MILQHSRLKNSGFSLAELITVIGVISLMSGIAVPIILKLNQQTVKANVTSNVASLNSAVNFYIANGGEIPDGSSISEVINKLKSVGANANDSELNFSGPFIDLRTNIKQNDRKQVGVKWNSTNKRFEADESADRMEVFLSKIPDEPIVETRKVSTVNWGSDWIWEYDESTTITQFTPTKVSLTPEPDAFIYEYSGPTVTVEALNPELLNVEANSAVNASFEENIGYDDRIDTWGNIEEEIAYTTHQSNVEGWSTTSSDNQIEIWQSGFGGVESYDGSFHAEFNAHEVSTLWQEVVTDEFDVVKVSFSHGQRVSNTEQLRLLVGTSPPPSKTDSDQVEDLEAYGFTEILTTSTDSVGSWEIYSTEYEILSPVDKLYFAFQSIGEFESKSYGNFLDQISFRAVKRASLDGLGVSISAGDSISNVILSAKIRLENAAVEDQLSFQGDLDDRFVVENRYLEEEGAIELTVTGRAFRYEYEELFEQINMTTTSEGSHDRNLYVTVTDGFAVSEPAEYIIRFE